MIVARLLSALSSALMSAAALALGFGDLCLVGARWAGGRAREWDPRLWDRDGDDRSHQEDRRP